MAKARTSHTLESVTKRISSNGTTLVQEEMKFGLADDEIGQMVMVDYEVQDVAVVITGNVAIGMSLDPDSNLDPNTDDVEDLEYLGGMNVCIDGSALQGAVGKTVITEDKVNFGTNIGLTVKSNDAAAIGIVFIVTVWFLRKKASTIELAKILLKRR